MVHKTFCYSKLIKANLKFQSIGKCFYQKVKEASQVVGKIKLKF